MVLFLEIIFFVSALLLIHSYLLYPLSIWILSIIINRKYSTDTSFKPKVSILISAYNEEKVIERTIRQLVNSSYDQDKMEIIVGSDNSTDKTNDILTSLTSELPNLKIYLFKERGGKPKVLNEITGYATGEILIFCDANTLYDREAVSNLVKYYKDQRIGGVSGKLVLIEFDESKEAGSQETKYWNAETWLKYQEGKLGILIGANGGIYSIRKELFTKVPVTHPVMDDFYLSLKVLEQGKDVLYERKAVAEELTAPSIKAEFNRKIRNNSISLLTLQAIKKLMKPAAGLAAYGLWSHKIIRWYSPVLLVLLLISNIFLLKENTFFEYTLYIQLIFYAAAAAGYFLKIIGIRLTPLLLCFYFVMTNVAMLIGIYKYLTGKQTAFWQSTPR